MNDRVRTTATTALHLAQKGSLKEAATVVQTLSGSDDLVYVMIAWIDTFIAHVYPDRRAGQPITLRFYAIETGELATADDVPPAVAWAGRMISCRAADDPAGFDAVLRSVPEGAALGDCVIALLDTVSKSLNNPGRVRGRAGEET